MELIVITNKIDLTIQYHKTVIKLTKQYNTIDDNHPNQKWPFPTLDTLVVTL